MIGDPGPYEGDDGSVWVPRTVPYLEARRLAKSGSFDCYRDTLVYVGKSHADLLGFSRACDCDERCTGGPTTEEYGEPESDPACRVPAWHFRLVER